MPSLVIICIAVFEKKTDTLTVCDDDNAEQHVFDPGELINRFDRPD